VGTRGNWAHSAVGTAAAAAASLMLAVVLAVVSAVLTPAGSPAEASSASNSVEYYLDLGGSASVGFQPTAARPSGQPTDTGYANDLVAIERARWRALQLVQFGCPGETTGSFSGGDRCRPAGQSQLSQAVAFLHTHPNTVLITVDLGFNDVEPCLAFRTVDQSCLDQRLDLLNDQLPPILAALRAAAGPKVRIVGVGHYDPFLGTYLHGGPDLAFSEGSVAAIERLDEALHAIYGAAGIPMADVGDAFSIAHNEPVNLAGVGDVPKNVAQTCALTWMCTSTSPHAKQHPNDAGYQVIAQAIAAVVPT
jgi:hypothetical protein